MKRILLALIIMGLSIPAMAFNVRNNTNVILCAWGPSNYFETVLPLSTSAGWYYTAGPTVTLYIASDNYYVCIGEEHPNCMWKCNDSLSSRTIPAHAQLVVEKAHCILGNGQWCPGGPQCISACDLANIAMSFDLAP